MLNLWRDTVGRLMKYVPGEPIESVKAKYGLSEVIKLASNENPLGTSPAAVAAMTAALGEASYYPEKEANVLREKLAEKYGLDVENFVVTNGGEYALTLLGNTFINPGDEAVYCTPTFGVMRSSIIKQEGIPVELNLTDDYKFDLEGMLKKITDKTKLVYICNPNNPTGTIVSKEERDKFVEKLPDHVVAVFDEAYYEFIEDKEYESAIKYVKEGKNVVVIRTFSKLYGMAGVRIGYAIANKEIIEKIFMVREAFSANRIGIIGAAAALDDKEFVEKTLNNNREGLKYFEKEFKSMGYDVIPSNANFVYVDLKTDISDVNQKMLMKGFVFRPWGGKMRVSVGTPEQNAAFMKALKEVLNDTGENKEKKGDN